MESWLGTAASIPLVGWPLLVVARDGNLMTTSAIERIEPAAGGLRVLTRNNTYVIGDRARVHGPFARVVFRDKEVPDALASDRPR